MTPLAQGMQEIADEGFRRFPELRGRANMSLKCLLCGAGWVTRITQNTDFEKLAEITKFPWDKCKCGGEAVVLSFRYPSFLSGFLPEFGKHEKGAA